MEETEVVIILAIAEDEDTVVGVNGIAEGLRGFWGKG